MEFTAEIGKVKKRYIFRPLITKAKKFVNIKKLSKRTLILILVILTSLIIGAGEIVLQLNNNLKNYYVLANSNAASGPLSLNSNLEITNNFNVTNENQRNNINSNTLLLDKRSYILDQYFLANHSPLYGTGQIFVEKCDKYGAPRDCLTVAAIARNETDLCKYSSSAQMFNCWGFGGAGVNRIRFNSFDESIDKVTKTLVYNYGSQYMTDPSLMERRFCGPDPSCVGWGNKIKFFIKQIDQFGKDQGLGSLLDLR